MLTFFLDCTLLRSPLQRSAVNHHCDWFVVHMAPPTSIFSSAVARVTLHARAVMGSRASAGEFLSKPIKSLSPAVSF